MVTYFYRCTCSHCGHECRVRQRITEDAIEDCPACGQPTLIRVPQPTTFVLKGGGWFNQGYSKTGG